MRMAWNTQQLADLADTTVKAVRYYHKIGLLEEPERSANGYYRRYGVPHLVRLLQIRRLSDLGVPLSDIERLGPASGDPEEVIDALDAELETRVTRLNRIRAELALIKQHRGSTYLPSEFASISPAFTESQRSLLMVYSTVLSDDSMQRFRDLLEHSSEVDDDFEQLPADADDAAIDQLAERILLQIRSTQETHPWSMDPVADAPGGRQHAAETMAEALVELYNHAQLRVLQRVNQLRQQSAPTPGSADST